jgi:hypothetical protein
MAIAHVQDALKGEVGSGSTSCSSANFGSSVTGGNALVVGVWGYADSSVVTGDVSCGDTASNSYTKAYFLASGKVWTALFYAVAVTGGSSFHCTISLANSKSAYMGVCAAEFSSLNASQPDVAAVTGFATSTTPNPGNITTVTSGDLVVATFSDGGANSTITDPTNYTKVDEEPSSGGPGFEVGSFVWRILSGTSTENPTWTLDTSGGWAAGVAALKQSAGSSFVGEEEGCSILTRFDLL